MKLILLINLIIFNTYSYAQDFAPCTSEELDLLKKAKVSNVELRNFLISSIKSNTETCETKFPRLFRPTVCGILISETRYYKFKLGKEATLDLSISRSKIACERDGFSAYEFQNINYNKVKSLTRRDRRNEF